MIHAAAAALLLLFAAPAAFGQNSEGVTWARANSCASIRAYLEQYPRGQFVAQARQQLAARNCPDPDAIKLANEKQQRERDEVVRRAREAEQLELAVWQGAMQANSIAAFDEYLRQYPSGRFRVLAQQNITRLRPPPPPAPATTTVSATDQELTRLASIRGDWIQSWLNSDTAPSYFRTGYFIVGSHTKTGGWATSSGYPCGGAIVRGVTWIKPFAGSTITFELVYGRLPTNTTAATSTFSHSRTTYLGTTWNDSWRAISEGGYGKSGQSCGALQDRRYIMSATSPPATTPAPSTLTTTQELARLVSIRGDWTRGWENTETAPSFFRSGYFMVGASGKSAGWATGLPKCGGAIVRGNAWSKPSANGMMTFELVYGRERSTSTSILSNFYPARVSYLGTTWNSAWMTTSEAAYRASGETCGAIQDRRSATPAAAYVPPAPVLSAREQAQRDIAGSWRRVSGTGCVDWQNISFPSGVLSWKYAAASATAWSAEPSSSWTISYETGRMVWTRTSDTKRRTIGLESGNLVWRVDGAVYCTFSRGTPPATIR